MTDPKFFAVTLADPGALPSPRAHPFVAVVSGSLRGGDEVEIVRSGEATRLATVSSVPNRVIASGDPDGQITFADLDRDELSPGDALRVPGLKAPPLSLEDSSGLPRLALLHAIKAARKQGFSTPYATLIRSLPDEAVVLYLEKAVRDALRPPRSAHNIRAAFDKAAHLQDAVGLFEEGDRLRLGASALLEGRPLGWDLMSLAVTALRGTMVPEPIKTARETLLTLSQAAGMRLAQVTALERHELMEEGGVIREHLQQRGRAVALGWCNQCKTVVHLTPHLHCPKGHDHIKECAVVVPSEMVQAEQSLRRRHK
jgi:hypothetical protein